MNIGLIGPGDIGSVIVRKLRDAGYSVKMANERGPESLKDLAAKTGAIPVSIDRSSLATDREKGLKAYCPTRDADYQAQVKAHRSVLIKE